MGIDVEGTDRVVSLHLPAGLEKGTYNFNLVGVLAEVWTGPLPNNKSESQHTRSHPVNSPFSSILSTDAMLPM
jgi:hypothetical protein